MFTVVAMAMALVAAEPAEPTPQPPPAPDPATEGQRGLASAAVCGSACLVGTAAATAGFGRASPLAFAAPVLGLVVSGAGAAAAEAVLAPVRPQDPPKARLWVPLWAAGGFVVVGAAGAAAGYVLGYTGSSDGREGFGMFGALLAGSAAGAVGAGIGTFAGLHNEPPDF